MMRKCKSPLGCPAPGSCENIGACLHDEFKDIEGVEHHMKLMDEKQRPKVDGPPMWVGAVIIAAFAVWVVAMLVKTGVV